MNKKQKDRCSDILQFPKSNEKLLITIEEADNKYYVVRIKDGVIKRISTGYTAKGIEKEYTSTIKTYQSIGFVKL